MPLDSTIHTKLLFHNDAQTPLGRLTLAGFIRESAGVSEPRVLGSYALVYLLDGSGTYQDAQGRVLRVRAGDMLVIFPEIAHSYGPEPGERWNEFYCVFDGPAFNLLRESGLLDPARPVLKLNPINSWLERLEAAMPDPSHHTVTDRVVEIGHFFHLLTEIAAAGVAEPEASAPAWIAEACQLLRAQPERDLTPEAVAELLHVPYETFRKRFQQHVGVSPGRYRAIRRIDAACALLQETRMTARKIAIQLGFNDEFHFSRRFKQITGVSPREFRRRLPALSETRE